MPGWKLFGHPLHCQVVHFPLALLSVVLPCDLIGIWRQAPFWREAAFWAGAGGLLSMLPAVATGLAELIALPKGHPGQDTALKHMGVMLAAGTFYLLSLLTRGGGDLLPVGLAAAGQLILIAGGWLGGELVFRHRIGIRG